MRSWLKRGSATSYNVDRRRRRANRLNLEPLEDRQLLSTCHVNRLADNGGGFGLRGDLRYCINKVNDLPGPDTIDFKVTGTINLNSALPVLGTEIDIVGPGSGILTVKRSGGGNYRIFIVGADAEVRITGLTLRSGNVPDDRGGGIYNEGTLQLIDTEVTNNTALYGGGIYSSGSLTLIDSQVKLNTAKGGGGIGSSGSVFMHGSSVSSNVVKNSHDFVAGASGGGISNSGSTFIQYSTVAANKAECIAGPNGGAECAGGGISGSVVTISYSTISGNTLSSSGHVAIVEGGGIYGGTVNISHSTIVGNTTAAQGDSELNTGAGIQGAIVIMSNSTVANNKNNNFQPGAGGIFFSDNATITHSTIAGNAVGIRINGPLTLRNSIVAKNTGNDLIGSITNSGFNLIGTTAGGSGFVPSDILNVDPKLAPITNNGGPTATMALLPGSPAIDSGTNQQAPEWDQRGPGFPRILNGTIDRGAFEVQATGAPMPSNFLAVLITADFEVDEMIG